MNTLRATSSVTRFIESFRCLDLNAIPQHPALASHNFEGNLPQLTCISIDLESDPCHQRYVDESVSIIMEWREKAKGLNDVLVTPYVHPVTLDKIIKRLEMAGISHQYINPIDGMPHKNESDSLAKSHKELLPVVTLSPWFDSIFIALTRATVYLSINCCK